MFAVVPEVKTIRRALNVIDFQLCDDDRNDFYIYAVNRLYQKDFPYPYEDYNPPKYFKILLKEIKPYCILE
jgi:hypothetical protein